MGGAENNLSPETLVQGVRGLVALPEIYIRVSDMVESGRHSAGEIANEIVRDADLSARLLRIVNSVFYGLSARIHTISRAITVVGTRELRDLVLATSAMRAFQGIPSDMVNMTEFWRHGVNCGVIARALAAKCNVLHGERLFVSGVLHDVGRLVLYLRAPDKARDIHLIAADVHSALSEAEAEVLGFTHAEIGGELLKSWGLPDELQAAVRFHHQPAQGGAAVLEPGLIHIADLLAHAGLGDYPVDDALASVQPVALHQTGLSEADLMAALDHASRHYEELSSAYV